MKRPWISFLASPLERGSHSGYWFSIVQFNPLFTKLEAFFRCATLFSSMPADYRVVHEKQKRTDLLGVGKLDIHVLYMHTHRKAAHLQ